MKINLTINYSAEAEAGETKADEDSALDSLAPLVEGFAEEITDHARAEGLKVSIGPA